MTNPAEIRERLKEILEINNFSAIEAEMYYLCIDLLEEVERRQEKLDSLNDFNNDTLAETERLKDEKQRLQKQVDVARDYISGFICSCDVAWTGRDMHETHCEFLSAQDCLMSMEKVK